MKVKSSLGLVVAFLVVTLYSHATPTLSPQKGTFNIAKDLLLVQFDCKTDVDDLHTVAALATLLASPEYSNIHYHAVAGTYGIQEGLYVPPNDLFQLAFGQNWTDAHGQPKDATKRVQNIVQKTLAHGGDIWIAEAGQSDFTAQLVKALQSEWSDTTLAQRIHVVQHSDWNENTTSPEQLQFVKSHTAYQKIPDGNASGNGTPGFRTARAVGYTNQITNPQLIQIWQLAIALSNEYNGKEGRYNNEAISAGGLDFSDLSEVCWILGIQDLKDTKQFFATYSN
ncbi:hypothetical protein BFP72_00960 [Reichenbachiella sp. 5M10]|uniref:hypothetical protein n=1 Tax=Reichenbachiella sp. 5M10 TaxID=1889772 RepID=UPI000C158ED1|nr:hypothetical protein [Reichenbachiella sp. 5M10]PIB34095.1 hypothetical protein BFP72_00960 [Reichenbachiella sp. 5M10]